MRGAAAPVSIAALLAITACSDSMTVVPAVPNPDGHSTEIFASGAPSAEAPEAIYVIDLDGEGPPLRFDLPLDDRRLEAYLLPPDLEELGLSPGLQTLDVGAPPAVFDAWTAGFEPGETVTWSPEPAPSWLESIRIPPIDPRACIAQGRCIEDGLCRRACATDLVPTPPMPPIVEDPDCPDGWALIPVDPEVDVHVCDPLREDQPCPTGQMRLPGEASCTAVAPPCAPADYAPLGPNETGVHVAANGTSGGDGTPMSPYDSIENAAAAAIDGDVILVSGGTFAGTALTKRLTVRAACPQQTTIGRLTAQADVTIEGTSLDGLVAVANATVRGSIVTGGTGTALVAGSTLTLERVAIHGAYDLGVAAPGTLFGEAIYIAGAGTGLLITGTASVTRARIESTTVALRVDGTADLHDVSLRAPRGVVAEGANLSLTDAAILATGEAAVRIDGGTATLDDLWVTGGKYGVRALEANVVATDLVVTDTAPNGVGFAAIRGESDLDRVTMVDLAGGAIGDALGRMTIEDLIVRRAGIEAEDAGGTVTAVSSVELRLDRAELLDVGGVAFGLYEGADGKVHDVRVDGAGTNVCRACTGFCIASDATADVARLDIAGVRGGALGVERSLGASVSNVVVDDTVLGRECDDASQGDGIVIDGSILTLEDFVVRSSAHAAVRMSNTQGHLNVTHRLERGRIDGAQVGLEVLLSGDWADRVVGVTMENVDQPVLSTE